MTVIVHDSQTRENALELLAKGKSLAAVARKTGIHSTTIGRWKRLKDRETNRLQGKAEAIKVRKSTVSMVPLDGSSGVVAVLDSQARKLLSFIEVMTESAGQALSDGNHSIFLMLKKIRAIAECNYRTRTFIGPDGKPVKHRVELDLEDFAEIGRLLKLYMGQLYENFTIPRGVIKPVDLLTSPAGSQHLHLHAAGISGGPLQLPSPQQTIIDVPVSGHLSDSTDGVSEEQAELLAEAVE